MRTTLWTGCALIAGGVAAVLVGAALDLELESTALLGVVLGAVVALGPDRTPAVRLAGFGAGVLVAWAGYLVRAALLPDTTAARAVVVALVIALCVGVALVTMNRVPLWSVLLGAGGLVGAYESAYAAAPPEVLDTSVTAVTTLLVTVMTGFLAAALVAPTARPERRAQQAPADDRTADLDSMMETTR